MEEGKLDEIMESLLGESYSMSPFSSEIDSVNVHIYEVEKWDKYRQKFGDKKTDDVDNETFDVEWDFELETRKSGIEGFHTSISSVEGRIEVVFFEGEDYEREERELLEFTHEDFEKMKVINDPVFSGRQQLFIHGLEIDFGNNTIEIIYL